MGQVPQSTLAFHGDAQLAEDMLREIRAHETADAFLRGEYYKKNGAGYKGFRGCFIGCAVHSYEVARGAPVHEAYDSVGDVERAFNFDPRLTKICEQVFERSDEEYAKSFLRRVGNAAQQGAAQGVNVRLVHWKFLHWMVKDTLAKHADAQTRKGCAKALAVLRDLARGINVTRARANAAANAADAAADAAAYAAAYAANAANAADVAADAVDAAADAVDAARIEEFGERIIALLAGEAA